MDIFNEYIVKKKKTGADIAVSCLAVALGLAICYAALTILRYVPLLSTFLLLVVAAVVWGIYKVVAMTNLEYEYIFTNGEMDVDKIINRRSRKRMTVVNARRIDILAHRSHEDFKANFENAAVKKINACTSPDAEDLYFILFRDESDGETPKMLLFNPNDKLLEGFRKYNPKRVFIEPRG